MVGATFGLRRLDLDNPFTLTHLGFHRDLFAEPEQTLEGVVLEPQLPADLTARLRLPDLPSAAGLPPPNTRLIPFLHFPPEGVFWPMLYAMCQDPTPEEGVIEVPGQPLLEGPLADASHAFLLELYGYDWPWRGRSVYAQMDGVLALDDEIEIAPVVGLAVAEDPPPGDPLADRTISWRYDGGNAAPTVRILMLHVRNPVGQWWVYLPGDVRSFRLPDVDGLEPMAAGEEVTVGKHGLLVEGLDLDGFDYADLGLFGNRVVDAASASVAWDVVVW